jgi:hypothetical protein
VRFSVRTRSGPATWGIVCLYGGVAACECGECGGARLGRFAAFAAACDEKTSQREFVEARCRRAAWQVVLQCRGWRGNARSVVGQAVGESETRARQLVSELLTWMGQPESLTGRVPDRQAGGGRERGEDGDEKRRW